MRELERENSTESLRKSLRENLKEHFGDQVFGREGGGAMPRRGLLFLQILAL